MSVVCDTETRQSNPKVNRGSGLAGEHPTNSPNHRVGQQPMEIEQQFHNHIRYVGLFYGRPM